MRRELYQKPCTNPLPEIHELFDLAAAHRIGLDLLEERTGYHRSTINDVRRPRGTRGTNPTFAMIRDIAQVLGYEFKLVRTGWRGQDEQGD